MVRLLIALVLADALFFIFVVASRRPLTPEQWEFLECQRPRVTRTADGLLMNFSVCADCLNMALARRPFGGWESIRGQLFLIANGPAYVIAAGSFHSLQARPGGSSQSHSDIATVVFCFAALLQWLGLAAVLSVRPGRRLAAN